MTFLQLCQKTSSESGTIAGLPSFTTVANQTGRIAKLISWVSDAYRDIQNERGDWLWLRKTFEKALVINQTTYTAASLSLEVATWIPDNPGASNISLYDPAIGASDEGTISHISWAAWRSRYDRNVHTANRPTEWAVTPQGALAFGTKPDKAYVIRGEYRARAQILVNDNDTPEMPEQFHGLIVGEALRLMARSDEAFSVLGEKAQQYDRLRYPLVRDQTMPIYDMWSGGTIG